MNEQLLRDENNRLREVLRQLVAVMKKQGESTVWYANYAEAVLENRRLDQGEGQ